MTTTVLVQAVLTGLLTGAVYGLVAMGLTLIFGVLEIVNFAHGAMLTLGMYLGFVLVDRFAMNPYATLIVVVPALFLVGAALQAGLLNRAIGQPLENLLLLTFGVAILIENGLLLLFGATPRSVDVTFGAPLRVLGAVVSFPRIVAFVAALVLAGALYWMLQRTKIGTAIRAVGQNAQGAALVGIDARRISILTFAVGASTVGAAAVLVLPLLRIEPTAGASFTIIAFVVVVLGGLGNVVGALIGGLAIGLIQQLGGVLLPGQDSLMAVFVVFLATLFLRPQGIFGGRVI
ncbi:MAG TPA: branched-chain amino acid ABC transporter permease [Euzebyales bacterium]|nr:branched-chain amino acid ABC transporter permease [Euzebyales bacterium]